jgi:hypothetical protein
MRASIFLATAALLATWAGCKNPEEAPFDAAALYAGRERINIAYDANLWGELIECG